MRLITLVDDYGRYDGRPAVLWGECFSVWNEKHPENPITLHQVAQMLQRLAADSVQLIEAYECDGKKVLQITQWQERVRDGAKEKWPSKEKAQESAAKRSEALPPSPPPPPPPSSIIPIPSSPPPPSAEKLVCVDVKKLIPDKSAKANGSDIHELIGKLNTFYRRPHDDPWSYAEQSQAVEVARRPRYPRSVEYSLARKKQFPISNIARHAGATKVEAALLLDDGLVTLRVHDNGRGITEAQIHHPESLGLLGMKERAALLGGDISFERGREGGTVVTVHIAQTRVTAEG
jgi:hypothetical protein